MSEVWLASSAEAAAASTPLPQGPGRLGPEPPLEPRNVSLVSDGGAPANNSAQNTANAQNRGGEPLP